MSRGLYTGKILAPNLTSYSIMALLSWTSLTNQIKAMFTLYWIVKQSVTESVPDRASVHTRDTAFEAFSASEKYCSAPLLKVEHSVSELLKQSESSLNTLIGAEIAMEPRFGKQSFQIKREH